jgi:curli biogenesis system outer membrane secretion channel CsgG
LGSALVAELTLSAGTTSGTYAPLEIELNAPTSASTGTRTSFIYASAQGLNVAAVDTNGVFFNLQGLTAGAGKMLVNELQ